MAPGDEYNGRSLATSWALAWMAAIGGIPPEAALGAFLASIANPAWLRPAEPAQITAMLARLSADLAEGALGVGVLLGYSTASSAAEYPRVAELAAGAGVTDARPAVRSGRARADPWTQAYPNTTKP
jgi:hypothetical protein